RRAEQGKAELVRRGAKAKKRRSTAVPDHVTCDPMARAPCHPERIREGSGLGRLRRILRGVPLRMTVCLALVAAIGSCDRSQPPSTEKTITLWYPWGQDLAKQLRQIADQFEKTHPGIRVRLSFAANNLTSSQKLFLAIAAGVGPDVTLVDGQQLAEW